MSSTIRDQYLPFGKPNFSEEEIDAVARVLRSGWIGMGPETIRFETELAQYLDIPHVVTVNSCTSALFLSLLVLGVKEGDEVICPSLTWCSTANAALYLRAKPVFCDIDPASLCASVDDVVARVTPRTKAVVTVHFGGYPMDVAALRERLPDNVAIVEDAAHALGARFTNGKRVGSSGNLTCFSFYANKNLSTGEGGAIALKNPGLAERLQSLRQHALPLDAWKRYSEPKTKLLSGHLTELGYKMNFTDLNAAIGRVQLRRQQQFHEIRREIARCYEQRLAHRVKFQQKCTDKDHARHLIAIQLPAEDMHLDRDDVFFALRQKNIGASIHYLPLHLMPLYRDRESPARFPQTESVTKRILTLPISASMTRDDANYVAENLIELMSVVPAKKRTL